MNERDIQRMILEGRVSEAERKIRTQLLNTPESADLFYLLGVAYHLQGKVGAAIQTLKKSLECSPKHTDAAICLSVILNDIGRYDEAKQVFEKANQSIAQQNAGLDSEIDRKFSIKHLELADLYFRYRRFDEAIEEYGRAIALDPKHFEIRIRRARAFQKKGYAARAISELEQIKAESPRFIPARIQLGLMHYTQGQILDAELEWEQVLEIDPSNKEVLAHLQMCKEARSNTERPMASL